MPTKEFLLNDLNVKEQNLLLTIYIGQEIHYKRGMLYELKNNIQFSENEQKIINVLQHKKFVKIKSPYTIRSIRAVETTSKGNRLAKTLLEDKLMPNVTLINDFRRYLKRS